MDKKHTALPWHWQKMRTQQALQDASGSCFAGVVMPLSTNRNYRIDREVHDANAAFIVRACNVHYELLEAAKFALRIAESWIHDQLDGTESLTGALLGLEPVRDVIEKAEAE